MFPAENQAVAAADRERDPSIRRWVEAEIDAAPNRDRLERQLDSVRTTASLACFLHRFVLFNDALAARVPYLAGIIHLTPNVFIDRDGDNSFCSQANGRIAAYVAEAASDEYRMTERSNQVHQYLSQLFFRGVLRHLDIPGAEFDRRHPLPQRLSVLLDEARARFLDERSPSSIFAALGFHVGLEFFAHQEFNLVDTWLRAHHPDLVAALKRKGPDGPAYRWLAIHTVVEIGHYRAGLEALDAALAHYARRDAVAEMSQRIKDGFAAFVALQRHYYDAILDDAG